MAVPSIFSSFERHLPEICAPLSQGTISFITPQKDTIRLSVDVQKNHAIVKIHKTTAATGKTEELSLVFRDKTARTLITRETWGQKCYVHETEIARATQAKVTNSYIESLKKLLSN